MLQRNPQIDLLVEQKLSQGSPKVQIISHILRRKPSQNKDQEFEPTDIFANSLLHPFIVKDLAAKPYGREDVDSVDDICLGWVWLVAWENYQSNWELWQLPTHINLIWHCTTFKTTQLLRFT